MKILKVLWSMLFLLALNTQCAQVLAQGTDSLAQDEGKLPVVGMTMIRSTSGITEMKTRGLRASTLVSAEVYNSEGEIIGKIDDLIVDKGAVVNMAVLSVGGFLGIGRHLIAISTLALYIDDKGRVILPKGTKEKLRHISAFKYLD